MGKITARTPVRRVSKAREKAIDRKLEAYLRLRDLETERLNRLYRFQEATPAMIATARARVGALDPGMVAEECPDLFQAWQAGRLRPWRVTIALNQAGFTGSWVDAALNVTELVVDWWEAGILYPRWEHLIALSELTTTPLEELLRDDDDDYRPGFYRCGAAFAAENLRKRYAAPIVNVIVNAHPEMPSLEAIDEAHQYGRVEALGPVMDTLREMTPQKSDLELARSVR